VEQNLIGCNLTNLRYSYWTNCVSLHCTCSLAESPRWHQSAECRNFFKGPTTHHIYNYQPHFWNLTSGWLRDSGSHYRYSDRHSDCLQGVQTGAWNHPYPLLSNLLQAILIGRSPRCL
jgi:hypothetical protein